jgi:menaquinone-specific isochorismate synthase
VSVLNIQPDELSYAERYGRLVSVALRVPGLTWRQFIGAARGSERFLWRDSKQTLAGSGIAAELTAWGAGRFGEIQAKAAQLFDQAYFVDYPDARPRLFGGFAFQDDFVPDNTWSVYSPAWFVLPHYQFTQVGDETPLLTVNITIPPDEEADHALRISLLEALHKRARFLRSLDTAPEPPNTAPIQTNTPTPYPAWEQAITRATDAIHAGELQKVVMARALELRFAERINIEHTLEFLDAHYPETYRFLFEPRPSHAFYGATPELLIKVDDDRYETMALAGSIRRGNTPDEDQQLGEALLNDPKERLEHALVIDAIRERLSPLTSDLHIPDTPGLLKLSNIQHLYTPVTGTLREPSGVLPLLEILHPTPALGGAPRDRAMQFIREAEAVPRGWYAAPIGWMDAEQQGTFGVGIRSAVVEDRRVWLYAGAGIVGGSQPQKEWDETTLKFRPMLNAHGVQG